MGFLGLFPNEEEKKARKAAKEDKKREKEDKKESMTAKDAKKEAKKTKWNDANEDIKYVIHGGKVQCQFCSPPLADIIVTSNTVMLQDKPFATVKDKDGKVNFNFTGLCNHPSQQKPMSPPPPCKAVINLGQWENYSETMINDDNALLVKSTIKCNVSGQDLKIVHSGQVAELTSITPMMKQKIETDNDEQKDLEIASSECQVDLSSTAELTKPSKEVKIVSATWVTNDEITLKTIPYKGTAYIFIKTENLPTGQVKVKVVDHAKGEKVAEWDKAQNNDMEFLVDIADNKGKKVFSPTDEWFSKRALDKEVSLEVYYNNEKNELPKFSLKITKINYNKDMIVSDNGVRFTACEEAIGFICPDGKIRAYKDTKGNWTIGIGEMMGIMADTVLESKDVAFDRFKAKIKGDYQKQTQNLLHKQGVKKKLKQYQFDAIVDLVYNAWSCDTLVGKIADEEDITESTFISFKGNGLTARRKAEYKLYTNQIDSVTGPKEFHRRDNTNGGYDKIIKEVQETQKVSKNGKMIDEPVFEMKDGKQVPKMKSIEEPGYYVMNSKETYTIQY